MPCYTVEHTTGSASRALFQPVLALLGLQFGRDKSSRFGRVMIGSGDSEGTLATEWGQVYMMVLTPLCAVRSG